MATKQEMNGYKTRDEPILNRENKVFPKSENMATLRVLKAEIQR